MTAPGPERILITEQSLEARLEGVGDAPHGDAPHWDDVDGKPSVFPPEAHTHTSSQVSDATATGRAVMTAASQSAARTAIGAGTSNLALGTTASTAKAGNYQPTWAQVSGKPATFPPESHTHPVAEVDGLQAALDGKAATGHTHTKAQVGLGNVDNTSDAAKPVSTATQAALTPLQSRVGAAPATWRWNGTTLPTAASQVHAQARAGDFIVAPNLTTDPGWHQITGV